MTGTELAIKLGFIVSKDGRVFLNDKEYTSSTYNKKALLFTFRNNGKKFQAYTGKIQAYQKFGNKALSDTTYYLDGNSFNVSVVLCSNCHRKLHYYDLSIDELRQLYSVPEAA